MKNVRDSVESIVQKAKANAQRNVKTNDEESNHEREYINKTAGLLVNRVMSRFKSIYTNYKYVFGDESISIGYKKDLIELFIKKGVLDVKQVDAGISACLNDDSIYPPKANLFVDMCLGGSNLKCPDAHKTLSLVQGWHSMKNMFSNKLKQPSHLVQTLESKIDWYVMSELDNTKALAMLNETYSKLIADGYKEPVETDDERLETTEIVKERMSDEKIMESHNRKLNNPDFLDIKKKLRAKACV